MGIDAMTHRRSFALIFFAASFAAQAQTGTEACLAGLRAEAASRGIAADITLDPTVLEALDNQPEFKTPIWDYLAFLVDEARIADGRAMLAAHGPLLARAQERFGVDPHTIVAIWGVESDYGRALGTRPLLRSLGTLACAGRRQAYFRGEFSATLKILQAGDATAETLTGSWAGAFGHTQFMPSTFLRLAVDFDGDGKRDIFNSIPDVIGSTANFLKRAGWASGEAWGHEVRLPPGYAGVSGRRNRQPLVAWSSAGLRRVDGAALSGPGDAALLMPAGNTGPAFLVFRNFNALYSYNAAESYGLAIAHLSDRLRGGGAFATPWPTADRGLSRAERREVQQRLVDRGYDIGAVDGGIGPVTRAAIRKFEASAGLPETGRAGGRVLDALRAKQP